jgi:hypothetical protein
VACCVICGNRSMFPHKNDLRSMKKPMDGQKEVKFEYLEHRSQTDSPAVRTAQLRNWLFPRSEIRGPIEARRSAEIPATAYHFRGVNSAAPLKHTGVANQGVGPKHFRGLKSAAPLKRGQDHHVDVIVDISAELNPRPL